jgi:hypothetical protein
LKVATFGSTYISPSSLVADVDIDNYMMVDDPSTITNFFDFGLGYNVPKIDDYDEESVSFLCTRDGTILYQYLYFEEKNMTYLHKWHSRWYEWKKKEDVPKTNFSQYQIDELKELYKTHNSKYDVLFNKLVKSRTNNIADLPATCRNKSKPVTNAAAPAFDEPPNPHVRIIEPAQTTEQLIETTIEVPQEFFTNQNEFVRRKQARLDSKLKEAEEARIHYEEAQRRKEDQALNREARARRRAAMKELRDEMNEVTENGVSELLSIEDKHVKAEDPEEDMINFSNVLAQLEVQSMFLKEDGLRQIRILTRTAIDRGRNHRMAIQRSQGGGVVQKRIQFKSANEASSSSNEAENLS